MNYYNEFDPKAAAWLRELITQGLIPDGVVDERSIVEVEVNDLKGFKQCHFFAGIAGWSRALELAGWSGPVWTASLPCQSWSTAGKQLGFKDERHLWPVFFELVSKCRPKQIFGEQVASAAALSWLDAVQTDLENAGYAIGATDLCAAGIGAPHIRQRLFWGAYDLRSTAGGVCNSAGTRLQGHGEPRELDDAEGREDEIRCSSETGDNGRLAGTNCQRRVEEREHNCQTGRGVSEHGSGSQRVSNASGRGRKRERSCREIEERETEPNQNRELQTGPEGHGVVSGLPDTQGHGQQRREKSGECTETAVQEVCGSSNSSKPVDPVPLANYWRDTDWLLCRDGKWRPVVATHLTLADGVSVDMVREWDERQHETTKEAQVEIKEVLEHLQTSISVALVEETPVLEILLDLENELHTENSLGSKSDLEAWEELDDHAKVRLEQKYCKCLTLIHPHPLEPKGSSNRAARLKGYGNAIVPPLAAEFIKAFVHVLNESSIVTKQE